MKTPPAPFVETETGCLEAPDDLIREQAYLIARRVRPLAIIGECRADRLTMLQAATRVEGLAEPGAVPFVLDRGDGTATVGYAACQWVLDLFRWLVIRQEKTLVPEQRDRIIGLLLGYGVDAIRRYEEERSGRLFTGPTASGGSDSS